MNTRILAAPLLAFLVSACGPTTTGGNSSTSSSSSSSGGTNAVVTTITPDQPIVLLAVARHPNGNFIIAEGQPKRVIEMDATGHVVHVDTDYTDPDWPNGVSVDDDGNIYVVAYFTVFRYEGSVDGTRTTFSARNGNDVQGVPYWGGSPRTAYGVRANNPTSPTLQIVRFDAFTATGPGEPTVVGEIENSSWGNLIIDDDNTIFLADSNQCRIARMTSAGVVSVVAGKEFGETGTCYNGGTAGRVEGLVGQGSGLSWDPAGTRLAFSDTANRVLLDVTPGSDGKSKANTVLVQFGDGVENSGVMHASDALYVVDGANNVILRVTL